MFSMRAELELVIHSVVTFTGTSTDCGCTMPHVRVKEIPINIMLVSKDEVTTTSVGVGTEGKIETN